MPKPALRSFTQSFDRIIHQIINEVYVASALGPTINEDPSAYRIYNAIWDTGATMSCITKHVADECDLKPTGKVQTYTASGEYITNTYLINIGLPNRIMILSVRVSEGKLPPNEDLLIGMDLITQGDFTITHRKEKTTVSFQMPSIHSINFGSFVNSTLIPCPEVERNKKCPCGSNKKFKNCHGLFS